MSRRTRLAFFLVCASWCWPILAQNPAIAKSNQKQAAPPVQGPPAPNAGRTDGAPEWFPLPPEQNKYLMDVLKFWEHTAGKVERYRCNFMRWEYDPVKLPNHPQVASAIASGDIQYGAPDKGLFKVEKYWDVAVDQNTSVPAMKDNRAQYVARTEVFDEHWICDGKAIFQVDGRNKQIIERELPKEMQGKQIAQGPLPFLFGAKAEQMLAEYWIRVIIPPPKEGRFWLEAIPKKFPQAADFRSVHVVIDEKEFLPEALMLYNRDGSRTNYEFQNREKNWNLLAEQLNPWFQQFYKPKLPTGWQFVREPFQQEAPQRAVNVSAPATTGRPPAAPARQAVRPSGGIPMKR